MKIAIMQPYFFPYLGYFQLADKVDEFVFLDDVNYFKKGFISRNAILQNGSHFAFSVSISKASQNKKINELSYTGEFEKLFALLRHNYGRCTFFQQVMPIVESVCKSANQNVALKNAASISSVFQYLEDTKVFKTASQLNLDPGLRGADRLISVCKELGASTYVNAIGGVGLYKPQVFEEHGIELQFLKPQLQAYSQECEGFVPGLSVIDAMMRLDQRELRMHLKAGELISANQAARETNT